MKLNYRGIAYEQDIATVDIVEGEISGKYRGQAWNCHYPRHIPVPQHPQQNLKYRGVVYNTVQGNTGVPEPVPEGAPEGSPEVAPTTAMACQIAMNNVTRVHCSNLRRILERRWQAAKERGDEKLMRLLEMESKQLSC